MTRPSPRITPPQSKQLTIGEAFEPALQHHQAGRLTMLRLSPVRPHHIFVSPPPNNGGAIVLDDSGWSIYREQRLLEDAWFAEGGYQVLELPTGPGLVIE